MTTWTVTTTSPRGVDTVIGHADTRLAAQRDMIAAVHARIDCAHDDRPRYRACIDGQLVALIVTGDDDTGLPDHRSAAAMAAEIGCAVNPYAG
ncbi:MAG: hypothetical protein AB7G47_10190 [Mycolicibacterium sp.]|uniref:hypothetical protein n=1 Tax=Mycolicibacterium sp. TaxID=2320850 RepID=UPI003D0D4E5E